MFGTFDDPVFCMDDELKDLEKKGADARREIKAAVDEDLPWLMGNP